MNQANASEAKSNDGDRKWAVLLGAAGIIPFVALLFVIAIESVRHVYGNDSKLFQSLEAASFSLAAAIVCAGVIACAVILLVRLRGARGSDRPPELGGLAFGIFLVLIGTSLAAVTVATDDGSSAPCAKTAGDDHTAASDGTLASAPSKRAGDTAH